MRVSRTRLAVWGAALAAAASLTVYIGTPARSAGQRPPEAPARAELAGAIGCLGRIEPEDGVLRVTAPYIEGAPPVVEALRVEENAEVRAGEVLATLAGGVRLQAAIREAEARVEASRRRLAQANDPPRAAEIPAQEAEVRRREAELAHARAELARYETLRKTDDVSAAETAARRTAALGAEHALDEARARLRSLAEIRPVNIGVAQAELDVALTSVQRLAANRDLYVVRAPAGGIVLRIRAHKGEQVGPEGLLELAKTRRLYAVAEVYESDAPRIRPGQAAEITGDALSAPLAGTVERVGGAVSASQVMPIDRAAFVNTRVVPVHIRLGAGAAPGLIHAKVSVTIRP